MESFAISSKPQPFSRLFSNPSLHSNHSRVRVSVRARDGDEKKRVVKEGIRRPLWQRGVGFVSRKLGFVGEEWDADPREERELEELDAFLGGRGAEVPWREVLWPTSVENVLALVLTGLFLYAGVLIGWQLLLVAAAITLSALKYAVIAAILLGVLIFFL